MISWTHEFNLCKYSEDEDLIVDLNDNLSPVTNLALNGLYNSVIEDNNIILAFPATKFKPLPIFDHIYAKRSGKSIINFSNAGYVEDHIKKYYLLADEDRRQMYLFYDIPIGKIKEESIEVEPYLPRISDRHHKARLKKRIKERFENQHSPRVLFVSDLNERIKNEVNSLILDNNTFNIVVSLNIGSIFIEYADRFLSSKRSIDSFINWVQPLRDNNIKIIIHLSNPEHPLIRYLKEKLDSLVLHFSQSFMKKNQEIINKNTQYFERFDNVTTRRIQNKQNQYRILNLDEKSLYLTDHHKFEIQKLNSGNLNDLYNDFENLLHFINTNKVSSQANYQYNIVCGLPAKLFSLVINPRLYKHIFFDPNYGWKYYHIQKILDTSKQIFDREDEQYRHYLLRLISIVYSMYTELGQSKIFGNDNKNEFKRITKSYVFENLLNYEIKNSPMGEKTVFVTQTPFERERIKEKYADKLENCNILILYVGDIYKKNLDISNTKIIFPGPLRVEHLYLIFQPFKKVLFLSYEGIDEQVIEQEKELVSEISTEEENHSLEYLKEVDEKLGVDWKKDPIFKGYNQKSKLSTINENSVNEDDFENWIYNIINQDNYSKIKEYENGQKSSELVLPYNESRQQKQDVHHIKFKVKNLADSCIYIKELPITKTYHYFSDPHNLNIQEMTPKAFDQSNYFILFEQDERKTFIQVLSELFEDETIDINSIESWKEELITYIDKNSLSYRDFYRQYCKIADNPRHYQTVLSWARGLRLAPSYSEDLYYIGKIINSQEIQENHNIIHSKAEAIRTRHRNLGRQIPNIVRRIIQGNVNSEEFSYEEQVIYDLIKNGIYQIIEIWDDDSEMNG